MLCNIVAGIAKQIGKLQLLLPKLFNSLFSIYTAPGNKVLCMRLGMNLVCDVTKMKRKNKIIFKIANVSFSTAELLMHLPQSVNILCGIISLEMRLLNS